MTKPVVSSANIGGGGEKLVLNQSYNF